tara:strand:- start:337 stop:2007 length:1671 start_codon:yes stop_codon:yes gene_type:complete
MSAVIEVKYFNSFILKKTLSSASKPMWNGSFGIPESVGGYPRPNDDTTAAGNWAIEEARIDGGYNNTSVDFGVKAYLVEEEPSASLRINSLIYSGIFNSRTGVNQTNVFSVGEDITKSVDPANGSIQRLYAENTNLTIFQELKVSRALIDKDAIYSAEGGGTVTSSNLVIGAIQPYLGKYGISKNPESFAVYGFTKYFSDSNNNVILKLTNSGIDEISSAGMVDYFRDELDRINTSSQQGFVKGGWDIHSKQYVVSTQGYYNLTPFNTLTYDDRVKGWTSFFTYKPDQLISCGNKFYTAKDGGLFVHYNEQASLATAQTNGAVTNNSTFAIDNINGTIEVGDKVTGLGVKAGTLVTVVGASQVTVNLSQTISDNVLLTFNDLIRNKFYGVNNASSIKFIFNPQPNLSKVFKTVNYEGSNGWQVNSIVSDTTGPSLLNGTYISATTESSFVQTSDTTSNIYSYTEGAYDSASPPNTGADAVVLPIYRAGFYRKENKYYANIVNSSTAAPQEVIFGESMSGIKGYFCEVTMSTDSITDFGGTKELFAASSVYNTSNSY